MASKAVATTTNTLKITLTSWVLGLQLLLLVLVFGVEYGMEWVLRRKRSKDNFLIVLFCYFILFALRPALSCISVVVVVVLFWACVVFAYLFLFVYFCQPPVFRLPPLFMVPLLFMVRPIRVFICLYLYVLINKSYFI